MPSTLRPHDHSADLVPQGAPVRHPAGCYAALFVNDDVYAARVDNLSSGGVAFVLPESIPEDLSGTATLFTLEHSMSLSRALLVVHSQPWIDSNYLVSCEFQEPLEWEELRDLLS